ncbi:MAG: tyrosine-type recombinase/integrase [Acidobacteria bacterium]|nr:tyrosine-type recombinase/integrase [Acidobacteriota bacterium]
MEPPRQAYPRAVHGSDGAGIRFRIVRDDEPGREDGAAILDQYEAARIGMAAPAQLRFNTASVRDLLRASGVRDPRDLQAAHIEAWLAGLARRGDSPHTRRNRLGGAGAVMSWLKKGHQIKHNPAREVDAPPVEDSPHIYLSESQREQALCIAAAAGIECEVTVALYAGLRMAELQRLRWRDVDLEGKAIMVVGAKGRNGTRKWRRVWLHSRAIAALHRQWQKTGAFEWVFPGGRRREDGAPGGGTWDRNRPRGRESWLSLLRPLQDAIPVFGRVPMGSTGRGWHTLRHTYASLGLQHGVDMKKISVWLGHSSIVTTERHYAWLAERYDPDCEKL